MTFVLSQNPTTITSPIAVNGTAVYGNAGTAWNVTNLSSIAGNSGGGGYAIGIDLAGAGKITNGAATATSAQITGYNEAIVIAGKGTVVNFATIAGQGIDAVGIVLKSGGVVTNGTASDTAASITGYGGDIQYQSGIRVLGAAGTVTNFGTIGGETGIYLGHGGTVVNSGAAALLNATGYAAVDIRGAAGLLTNSGTITGHGSSVYLANGTVTNNAGALISALNVSGVVIGGPTAHVANYGRINAGLNGAAVYLANGGSVLNHGVAATLIATSPSNLEGVEVQRAAGSVGNTGTISGVIAGVGLFFGGTVSNTGVHAMITGQDGIEVKTAPGRVVNLGTVTGTGTANNNAGIYFAGTGSIANGSATNKTALITGYDGIIISGRGTVTNDATIRSGSASVAVGISLVSSGVVINGTTAATAGRITGTHIGVMAAGPVTVTNFGTIENVAAGGFAIYSPGGGMITNGGGTVTSARLFGTEIAVLVGKATIANQGTIIATASVSAGIDLTGGAIANGTSTRETALIEAKTDGIYVDGVSLALTVTNFGTIAGTGASSVGILFLANNEGGNTLTDSGTITNGASTRKTALIEGKNQGIYIHGNSSGVKVTNFGTIAGTGTSSVGILFAANNRGTNTITDFGTISGTDGSVLFAAGKDRLILEATAVLKGRVTGGSGTDDVDFFKAGVDSFTGFTAFETVHLENGAAHTLTLTNANFLGVTNRTITVTGGNHNDTISEAGVSDDDTAKFIGGAGVDTLIAGPHATMTGGTGADVFEFTTHGSTADPNQNLITDFTHAGDHIAFSNKGFALGLTGASATPHALPAALFSTSTTGTFTTTTQRFAYNKTNGDLFYSAHGSGGTKLLVSVLGTGTHPTVTAGDLFFVT